MGSLPTCNDIGKKVKKSFNKLKGICNSERKVTDNTSKKNIEKTGSSKDTNDGNGHCDSTVCVNEIKNDVGDMNNNINNMNNTNGMNNTNQMNHINGVNDMNTYNNFPNDFRNRMNFNNDNDMNGFVNSMNSFNYINIIKSMYYYEYCKNFINFMNLYFTLFNNYINQNNNQNIYGNNNTNISNINNNYDNITNDILKSSYMNDVICVIFEINGEEKQFLINRNHTIEILLSTFKENQGLNNKNIKFLFGGNDLEKKKDLTISETGLLNGAKIKVWNIESNKK